MVPALARRLPALDAAMPMALASRPASSPSRCPTATAAPSGPAAPGGWNWILRASNCPDACRIQPCISTPLTSAVSTSRPLSPRASASASTPPSVVESAWFAGLHIGSKSSTCMAAPLSAAAETVLRRKPCRSPSPAGRHPAPCSARQGYGSPLPRCRRWRWRYRRAPAARRRDPLALPEARIAGAGNPLDTAATSPTCLACLSFHRPAADEDAILAVDPEQHGRPLRDLPSRKDPHGRLAVDADDVLEVTAEQQSLAHSPADARAGQVLRRVSWAMAMRSGRRISRPMPPARLPRLTSTVAPPGNLTRALRASTGSLTTSRKFAAPTTSATNSLAGCS